MLYLSDVTLIEDASERQILYRIDKINVMLIQHNLPKIEIGKNKEMIISDESRKFLIEFLYEKKYKESYNLNSYERKAYLYLMMFIKEDYISMQDFLYFLEVSKSTVNQDLKNMSVELSELGIEIIYDRIIGYHLHGSETMIRQYLMKLILTTVSKHGNNRVLDIFIDNNNLQKYDEVKIVILRLAKRHKISFVEDRLTEFIYIFIILTKRINSDYITRHIQMDVPIVKSMKELPEYKFTETLFKKFISDPKDQDIQYLTSWVLGISIGNVEETTNDLLFIGGLVGKIIHRFEMISGVKFQNKEEIYRHIYSHFRPAYYRILYKHPIINPLKETVINEYADLYFLVEETLKPLQNLSGYTISEDEIAYLTMHFSLIYGNNIEVRKRYKGLILCLNGVGSSIMLYNELISIFGNIDFMKPLMVSNVNFEDYNVDIIFTTHIFKELHELKIPVIKVNPLMDNTEKLQVIQEAKFKLGELQSNDNQINDIINVIDKHFGAVPGERKLREEILQILTKDKNYHLSYDYPNINSIKFIELIHRDAIAINIEARDWKEAVYKTALPLVQKSYITGNYLTSILEIHESEVSHFVISPLVALPHTRPDRGAIKHGIAIGILKNPVKFYDKDAKYIFFLSAPDNQRHIKAMAEFLELLSTENFYELLESAQNSDIIYDYIYDFSKK